MKNLSLTELVKSTCWCRSSNSRDAWQYVTGCHQSRYTPTHIPVHTGSPVTLIHTQTHIHTCQALIRATSISPKKSGAYVLPTLLAVALLIWRMLEVGYGSRMHTGFSPVKVQYCVVSPVTGSRYSLQVWSGRFGGVREWVGWVRE